MKHLKHLNKSAGTEKIYQGVAASLGKNPMMYALMYPFGWLQRAGNATKEIRIT